MPFPCYDSFFCASRAAKHAWASWSPQEVGLNPQVMPFNFSSTSSTVNPSTKEEIAFKLPLHPLVKVTCFQTFPSKSKSIWVEQVPLVLYV